MQNGETSNDPTSTPVEDHEDGPEHREGRGAPISRRQAIGRLSAVASAGAAAWVVPEILTARPAAGATLSGETGATYADPDPDPDTDPDLDQNPDPDPVASDDEAVTTAADTKSDPSLAFTGLNLESDAQVGAALIAGGWAMHHWASRRPNGAKAPPPAADEA